MTEKSIWFYTTHIIDDMKKFVISAYKKEDKQIAYSELKSLTKKDHPYVVTNEMNRAIFSFQHKLEGKLFLLEHGIELAKNLEGIENQNLELSKELYKNHILFKFALDCVLSFGTTPFSKRQYYNRVQTRAPIFNYKYKNSTSKQLNYVLGFFIDLDILGIEKLNKEKLYNLKTFDFLRKEKEAIKKVNNEELHKLILKEIEYIPNAYKLGELIPIPKLRDKILFNHKISNEDFERSLINLFNDNIINFHSNDQKVEGTLILPTSQEVFYISKIGD